MNKQYKEMKRNLVEAMRPQIEGIYKVGDLRPIFERALSEQRLALSDGDIELLFDTVAAELLDLPGLGPLEPLLEDAGVSAIMINGPYEIWVERGGQMQLTGQRFEDVDALMEVLHTICAPLGLHLDESHPIVGARLADHTAVNIVMPPIALNGPTVAIRKAVLTATTLDELAADEFMTPDAAAYLRACLQAGATIAVAGMAASGKTRMLAALARELDPAHRIIALQRDTDLALTQPHVVTLETRPPNLEGRGEITMAQLIEVGLRLNPGRLVVDFVATGEELMHLLNAARFGLKGTLFSVHAASPPDMLNRLEVMLGESLPTTPVLSLRQQLQAIDVIVVVAGNVERFWQVVSIAEVGDLTGGMIATHNIFAPVEGQLRRIDVPSRYVE